MGNTTFMQSGISPTCPRHGRAAQMMIAAAAAVSRANSVGAPNSLSCSSGAGASSLNNYSGGATSGTPMLVPLLPASSSPPTTLEEAQV